MLKKEHSGMCSERCTWVYLPYPASPGDPDMGCIFKMCFVSPPQQRALAEEPLTVDPVWVPCLLCVLHSIFLCDLDFICSFWCLSFALPPFLTVLEARNPKQGVFEIGSFGSWEGGFCSRSLSLACRWPPCVSSHYVFVSKFPLVIRTPVILGLFQPSWPHFNKMASIKILCPNRVIFWDNVNIWIFWWGGTQFSL